MKPEKTYPASRALASGLLAFAAIATSMSINAANVPLYWDTDSAPGIQSGNGTWNTSNTNWSTASDGSSVPGPWVVGSSGNRSNAYFGGGAAGDYTVTLGFDAVVNFIQQTAGTSNYTLTGRQITLGNAGGLRVNSGVFVVESTLIAGANLNMNLSAATGTTLVLAGDNTLSTTVQIGNGSNLDGTVKLANANALGGVSTVNMNTNSSGQTLDINGYTLNGKNITSASGKNFRLISSSTTSDAEWAGNISIGAGTTLTAGATGAGKTLEISGEISGATGNLTTLANSHLILSGTSTYSGATTIAAGSTFELAATGFILFNLNAGKDGIVNVMTGTGTAILDGTFTLSFNLADVAEGASLAFLASDISATYGSSFTLRALDATLTKVAGAQNLWAGGGWIYDMGTGVFSRGVIPEPATTIALLGGAAILAASVLRRRK
ncbi:PEP-CTERM sorting domain-containing protein [Opitutaceae bacterium TAV4]|nr:PEP-CTERM sorting domain-containing protein [Opitutaceae bacterium TAV4]RRK01256.1 PEP-CTERM sorting domain-containing protein [Opitutaceae bacterium TAV3]